MTVQLAHFAINADDVEQSREFYRQVFGWTFTEAYPGFFRAEFEARPIIGAIQARRDLQPGLTLNAPEVTYQVDDAATTAAAVEAAGGRIVMAPTTIDRVGTLVFFADPSGNVLGAIQFGPPAE
jgi:uncharacterized protein